MMAHAARMTDYADMELLEREPPLALLATCACAAPTGRTSSVACCVRSAALTVFDDFGASAAARLTRQRLRALGARSIPAGPRSATREDHNSDKSRISLARARNQIPWM